MTTYKLRRISLVPDKHGQFLKIQMVSKYVDGIYKGHVKINQEIVYVLLSLEVS